VAYYDLATRAPADPLWKFKSTELGKVCRPVPGHPNRWTFVASRAAHAGDPASRHQVALRDLAAANGWSVLPPKAPMPRVSSQPIEVSAFFKAAFDAALLEVATGDQVLMAAKPDVFGRHRLVFSKATGRWVSLSVHGGTVTGSTALIQANIHRATFVPHARHFILIQHYDARRHEWYPWSWLIPSTDFAELARGKGAYLFFTTTLNPTRGNRWTPYRVATAEVAMAVLAALGSSLRAAA
jgi:hypothetical protein